MRWLFSVLLASAAACSAPTPSGPPPDPVALDRDRIAFALAEENASPHQLFRRINIPFSQAVCDGFRSRIATMPRVNLHGDAHLEQYAVTADSAGLVDFDDSSSGPAVLDLARLGSSIFIAADMLGWNSERERILDAFLDAYRAGLQDPALTAKVPAAAQRLRDAHHVDREAFLDWATSLMQPLDPDRDRKIREGHERYVALMLDRFDKLTPSFFRLKAIGSHFVGVGSARTDKVLGRIEGPTDAPDDDVILEGKELRDLSEIDCVYAPRGDALRVVLTQSNMGSRRDPFLAVMPRSPDDSPDDPPYWVQSWSASYAEIRIASSFQTPDEMAELVRDVGIQLAQGHMARNSPQEEEALRVAQRSTIERDEPRLRELIEQLSRRTIEYWRESRP